MLAWQCRSSSLQLGMPMWRKARSGRKTTSLKQPHQHIWKPSWITFCDTRERVWRLQKHTKSFPMT
eukprot:7940839-Prorocentrum_lima.AAC.1